MMGINKITSTNTNIGTGSDGIRIDGDYLMAGDTQKSGKVMVRCGGEYGGATVSVGFLDNNVFSLVKQPDGSDAAFTSFFALEFITGKQKMINGSGPAIKVSGISGTSAMNLVISEVD